MNITKIWSFIIVTLIVFAFSISGCSSSGSSGENMNVSGRVIHKCITTKPGPAGRLHYVRCGF